MEVHLQTLQAPKKSGGISPGEMFAVSWDGEETGAIAVGIRATEPPTPIQLSVTFRSKKAAREIGTKLLEWADS
jgi:hypothetical protein